jgi:pimeloyl-ACP methyl ester carboxylesterase
MPYEYRYSASNIQNGAWDAVFRPRDLRGASKYPVILLHGASGTTGAEAYGVPFPSVHQLAVALANQGVPVVAGYMGGNTFANDTISGSAASAYVNAALTYVSAATGCSSAKAHVIGFSMGAGIGIRWASLNPTKAASVTGMIPNVSISHLYTDNPNYLPAFDSFTQVIGTAWGTTIRHISDGVITSGSATMTSATAAFTSADIGRQIVRGYTQTGVPADTKITSVTNATTVVMNKTATASGTGQVLTIASPLPMTGTAGADLIGVHAPRLLSNGVPSRMYYASDDPYIYPADVTAFASASGGSAFNMGTGGHSDAIMAKAMVRNGGSDWSDLIAWLKVNGA